MSAFCKRLGSQGYVDILRCVIDGPVSRSMVMERCGVNRTNCWRILETLHHMRIIHIAGWDERPRTAAMPLYAYGDLPDVAPPTVRPNGRRSLGVLHRGPTPACLMPEVIAFANILKALEEPATRDELRARTGSAVRTLRVTLDRLLLKRVAFICDWEPRRVHGPPIPRFQIGIDEKDAKRPAPMPKNVVNARYRLASKAKAQDARIHRALAGNSTPYREAVAA